MSVAQHAGVSVCARKIAPQMARLVMALALCVGVSACGLFGSNKAKPAVLADLKNTAVTTAWSASVGKSAGYLFTPAFADKLVFIASHKSGVTALSDEGGRQVSRIEAKAPITGGVGAAENFITVASDKGDVLAFDSVGRPLWTSQVAGSVLAAPVIAGGNVIVRTADGRIFALNRADGKRKWVFQRTTPALTLRTNAGVVVNRGAVVATVYAGFAGGKIVAIEAESGKPIWESTISTPRGSTELERVADVSGVPVLDEARICAAVYQGRTGCVEALTGNVLWSREISSSEGVAVDEKYLYVADTDGNVFALDKSTGATTWKQEKLQRREPTTPLAFKGKVLIGDSTGLVHLLSPDNGELIGRIATDGSTVVSLQASGDRVIAQTAKGGVYALAVK